MKKLYIIRHGKSDWGNPEVNDFNRALNHRGLKDAPRVGKFLLDHHEKADIILSSPAKRALTTAQLIANEINFPNSGIIENEKIYLANKESILQIINTIDDQYNCAYIFGHNPGFSNLASYLTDDWIEMKTCCVAILNSNVNSWSHLSKGNALLERYVSPKNIN
jgi:phosphohistidine phosphatase